MEQRRFEPDEMAVADTTYRFGKDPRTDVRVILATSWRRGFCFEGLD